MTDYFPVRVSTLRGDQKIPFNAFVQVAGKYILYCREGDSFEGERLERLKAKKLAKMYIPDDKKVAYQKYMRENIESAYDLASSKSIQIRTEIIHGAMQAAAEDWMEDTASESFYRVALEGARRFTKFFYSEPAALDTILAIKNTDFSIAHHGVVVTAISLAIAEAIGLAESRPMQLDNLVVGALVHDIEHNFNNLNFTVPSEKLTAPEKRIHREHAGLGRERLSSLPFVDPLVLDVVGLHEERIDGAGPLKTRAEDVDPLVQVVAAANHFDHLLLYEDLTIKEALKKYLIDKIGALPLEHMKGLQEALKKREIL